MAFTGLKKLKKPRVIIGAILGLIVLFLIVMFVGNVFRYVRAIRSGESDPFEKDRLKSSVSILLRQTPLDQVTFNRIMTDAKAPSFGNPNAKIRIVEFLDYQCPFSKKTAPFVREFMANHSDDAFLIIRDYPITSVHNMATDAAYSAQCVFNQGGAEKYWSYQDFLFQNQDKLTATNLRDSAISVGLDPSALDACVNSRETKSGVEADTADTLSVNVNGTPTFFINGYRIPGAVTLEQLEAIYAEIKKRL